MVVVPPAPSRRPLGREFGAYLACSAAALAIDTALFRGLLALGLGYPLAAVAGFIAGLATSYGLSVRLVFRVRAVADRRLEFLLFAGVGVVGLVLTELLLWLLMGHLGIAAVPAKLATAGVVFVFNFTARKLALFTRPGPLPARVTA